MMGWLTEWAMFRLSMAVLITALSCEMGLAEENINSANFVMKGCREGVARGGSDLYRQGYCFGILTGLAYDNQMVCIPKGVTNEQTLRVVVRYIDQQPARLHESFRGLATEALRQTWPCKRRGSAGDGAV
jgi:hypothetical protein